MKLFVDTADLKEIEEAASWGILDGCTTNPSLVMKSGRDFKDVADAIFRIIPSGEVSLEVVSDDAEGVVRPWVPPR